jgi:hypothetical protein
LAYIVEDECDYLGLSLSPVSLPFHVSFLYFVPSLFDVFVSVVLAPFNELTAGNNSSSLSTDLFKRRLKKKKGKRKGLVN